MLGADHEEAHPESDKMSQVIGKDNLLWTNRSQTQFCDSPMANHEERKRNQRNYTTYVPNSASLGLQVISLDELKHVLADSNQGEVDGELRINGMSFKVVNNRSNNNRSTFIGNNRSQLDLSMGGQNNSRMPMPTMMQPELNLSIDRYQPPMNEQRSTDEPILVAIPPNKQHQFQPNSRREIDARQMSDVLLASSQARTTIARQDDRMRWGASFAALQSPTAQIPPIISQNISGGSLSPGDSLDSSPIRNMSTISVQKWEKQDSKQDNKISSQIAHHQKNQQSKPFVNNFFSETMFRDQTSIPLQQNQQDNMQVAKDGTITVIDEQREEQRKKSDDEITIMAALESSNGPCLDFHHFQNSIHQPEAAAVIVSPQKEAVTSQGGASSIQNSEQKLPNAMPNLALRAKKKKKPKLVIDVPTQNDSVAKQTQEVIEPVVVPSTTLTVQNVSPKNPETPKMGKNCQQSVYDAFLKGLEDEIGQSKKRKVANRSPKEPRVPRQQLVNLNDLDKEFIKAQLKRNNSDSIRNKDELKSKRIILRELQDLKDSLFYQQDHTKSDIDIGFLHASPIFIEGLQEGKTSLVPLKFQEEKKAIIEAIKQSDQHVRFRQSVATKDKFIEMIRKRPSVLHISCHGFDQTDQSMQLVREEDLRNLLFETENGDGKLISQRELSKILKQGITKIKVVFVAACMSQFVGEIFQQCDVPHVICSQQGKTILDKAAISFSQSFYMRMLKGETICKAFQQARDEVSVKFSDEEANRFQLMISTGQHKHKPKHCTSRWPTKRGDLVCKSDHIKFKNLRTKLTNFIPREIEFFKLVQDLQNEHKLVHYRGLPGIGKTHLVRNVLHYLSERKYFQAGIIYFPLNDVKSAAQFLVSLRNLTLQFFQLTPQERFELIKTYSSVISITDFMVNMFDDKALPNYELKKQKSFSNSKDRRFLLALDNCEALIDKCGEEFRNLISLFCDQCKLLKIIVISRNELGSINEGEQIQPLILPQLGSKQAVQFFLDVLSEEKRMNIKTDEIVDLLLGSAYYPFNKAFPNKGIVIPKDVTEKFRQDFARQVENHLSIGSDNSKLVEILSYHDLFRLLQGNPTSLSRVANVYLNPFNNVMSLLNLYNMVKQNNISGEHEQKQSDDTRPKPRLNNESLQTTTKLAIDMLPSTEAKSLLYFIGCMPAGLSRRQLNEIWGSQKVVMDLPSLQNMNLVEQSDQRDDNETKYELSPVLCQFIDQDIEEKSKEKFMDAIISHYAVVIKDVYKIAASNKEKQEDLNESPTASNWSPRKNMNSYISGLSFNNSFDSMNFEQLSELNKGLHKKSFEKGGKIMNAGLFSGSTVDISITSLVYKDLPNLTQCLEFLIGLNTSQLSENSYFGKNDSTPRKVVSNVKLNDSFNKDFSQSINLGKTIMDGAAALSLMNLQKEQIASQLPSARRTIKKLSSHSTDKVFESSSSQQSPKGVPIFVEQISKSSVDSIESPILAGKQFSIKHLPHKNRNSVKAIKRETSQLEAIEETQEHHYQTRTSQQSRTSEEETKSMVAGIPKSVTPMLKKNDSSPFPPLHSHPFEQISQISGRNQKKDKQLSPLERAKTSSNDRVNDVTQMLSGIEMSLKKQDSILSVHTINALTNCDKLMKNLQERESMVKGTLNPMVKNSRQIIENFDDESSSEDDRVEQDQEQEHVTMFNHNDAETAAALGSGGKGKSYLKVPVLVEKHPSNIQVSHLESDRSTHQEIEDRNDPMTSIRTGSDLDDQSSVVSNFQYMSTLNQNQLNKDITLANLDGDSFKNPSSDNQGSANQVKYITNGSGSSPSGLHETENFAQIDDQFANMRNQNIDRRHTFNIHMLQRRKSSLMKEQQPKLIDTLASSTMKLSNRNPMSKEEKKALKVLHELDQSAVFTLRRSGNSGASPKGGSQVKIPKNSPSGGKNNQNPSPDSAKLKSSYLESMTLYGQFVIYLAATAFLIDDITFAYQITSTNFDGIAGSYLFSGNILRLKALAAEQIFVRYYDPKDQENSFEIVYYLIEAIQAATESLNYYKGEGGYVNQYGMGLQNFHLGYLYEKYSEHLSSKQAQETYRDICGNMTDALFREKALGQFREAFQYFDTMVHLKGMYLAKMHEAYLYNVSDDAESSNGYVQQRAIKNAKRLRRDYFEHVNRYGYQDCCHIPRHHGEQISLLTEIVGQNKKTALFRTPSTTHNNNNNQHNRNKDGSKNDQKFKRINTVKPAESKLKLLQLQQENDDDY